MGSARVVLGRAGRRLVAAEADSSVIVVGPTGCGKTAGLVIPALLEWSGPVLATSVKTDLIAATMARRRAVGAVQLYDPTGVSGEIPSWWDPLAEAQTWAGAQALAASLVDAGHGEHSNLRDADHWHTQARKALAPYLHAAALGGRTLMDVAAWIDSREEEAVEAILVKHDPKSRDEDAASLPAKPASGRALAPHPQGPAWREEVEKRIASDRSERVVAPGASPARLAANALWSKERRLRDSVMATVENVLVAWAEQGCGSPPVGCPDDDRIDMQAWLSGPNTLYVVASGHDQSRLRPVLTTVVAEALRAAFLRAASQGGRLTKQVLVLLDEAANIAPIRALPAHAATARSHGIAIVSVWQDMAQIEAVYGSRAQTVMNNHRAKVFGAGVADTPTLDYVSRLCGEMPVTERSLSTDLERHRRSVSTRTAWRPAAPPDLVRRMPVGQALLVHGHEPATVISLRPWYADRRVRRLAEAEG